jgi:hypothetical protein
MIIDDVRVYKAVALIRLVIYDRPIDGINILYILFEERIVYLRTADNKGTFDGIVVLYISQSVLDGFKNVGIAGIAGIADRCDFFHNRVVIVGGYYNIDSVF